MTQRKHFFLSLDLWNSYLPKIDTKIFSKTKNSIMEIIISLYVHFLFAFEYYAYEKNMRLTRYTWSQILFLKEHTYSRRGNMYENIVNNVQFLKRGKHVCAHLHVFHSSFLTAFDQARICIFISILWVVMLILIFDRAVVDMVNGSVSW